jgi:hypothetical protein
MDYRKIPIAAMFRMRQLTVVRRALLFGQKPGKKRKGGKSRVIGISGLGRFFLFFPDSCF